MRVLVTGAGGFAGRHAAAELTAAGHEVLALDLPGVELPPAAVQMSADLLGPGALEKAVRDWNPEGCLHLAGVAFVPMGWTDPEAVFSANVMGTLRLLEVFRQRAPLARLLVVTSAEIYGRPETPPSEEAPFAPENLYALSKQTADVAARLYARRYGMPIVVVRPGNHFGPGQSSRFVTAAFAEQVAAMALGRAEPVIRVGNLDSKRGFLDVRDVVRAYRLLLEKGRPGEAYNVGAERGIRIGALLDELCRLAGVRPRIETDPARYRPADVSGILDCGKSRRELGWEPGIPMQTTLRDILDDARRRLEKTG